MHDCCCRYERGAKEDGRRCHKWFLVDEAGTEHLAVIGLETDTLDGHYTYQAVRSIRQAPAQHSTQQLSCMPCFRCAAVLTPTALSTSQVV